MSKTSTETRKQRSRDDPKENQKKRKPIYLKDRRTSSGVMFGV